MPRLIDADALIEQMEADAEHFDNAISKMMYYAAISDVKHAPTIESERKTGKWIVTPSPDKYHCGLVKCPYCQEELIGEPNEYHYCPWCGAKMEVEHAEI